ncbi:MAG: hypothetical protein COT55_01570 [Candidatus Diapherotrites archaeon CG09_land_8_20_14_0_10_32_12]|nr:MAG: hypothetical protein COT55_01570 [Candidatus Diapherotrites archaeon CG09_land_8_20_14_0_10_32_12]
MLMYKYTIAKQLASKRVITGRGEEVGKLIDVLVNELTGDVEYLLDEIDSQSKLVKSLNLNTGDRIIKIPYAAVSAVSDVFIVDEKQITAEAEE